MAADRHERGTARVCWCMGRATMSAGVCTYLQFVVFASESSTCFRIESSWLTRRGTGEKLLKGDSEECYRLLVTHAKQSRLSCVVCRSEERALHVPMLGLHRLLLTLTARSYTGYAKAIHCCQIWTCKLHPSDLVPLRILNGPIMTEAEVLQSSKAVNSCLHRCGIYDASTHAAFFNI